MKGNLSQMQGGKWKQREKLNVCSLSCQMTCNQEFTTSISLIKVTLKLSHGIPSTYPSLNSDPHTSRESCQSFDRHVTAYGKRLGRG